MIRYETTTRVDCLWTKEQVTTLPGKCNWHEVKQGNSLFKLFELAAGSKPGGILENWFNRTRAFQILGAIASTIEVLVFLSFFSRHVSRKEPELEYLFFPGSTRRKLLFSRHNIQFPNFTVLRRVSIHPACSARLLSCSNLHCFVCYRK